MRPPALCAIVAASLWLLLCAVTPALAITGRCAPPVSYTNVQLNSAGVWLSPPANFSTSGCVVRIDAALQGQADANPGTSLYLQVSMRTPEGFQLATVQQSIAANSIAPINATVVACPDPELAVGQGPSPYSFVATGTPGAFFSFVASVPSAQLSVPYESMEIERVDPTFVRSMFFVLTEEMIKAAQSVEVKVETARPVGNALHDCELAMLYVGSTLQRPANSLFNPVPVHNFQSCPDTTTIQYDNKFSSRLTFFDHGAIVLSSGSRPPLEAGATIFVGVTSLGRHYGGDFCEFPPTPEDMAASQQVLLSHQKEYRISVTVIPKEATVQFAIAISFLCLMLFLLAWTFAACPCLFPWACYSRRGESDEQRAARFAGIRRRVRPYWRARDEAATYDVGWSGCGGDCLHRAFSMWFHTALTGRRRIANPPQAQPQPNQPAAALPAQPAAAPVPAAAAALAPAVDPALERPYSYSWFFLTTISAFFITAIQFVITNWTLMRETGNRDLCYYNEMCFRPMASPTNLPWNNLLSNLPYVAAGLSFIIFVSLHETRFIRPRQSTLYYAMGWSLVGEGLCSLGYHICPRPSVFQMDTACMYAIAIIGMLNLYQHGEQRHRNRPIFRAARVFLFLYIPLLAINYLGVWHSDAARAIAVVLLLVLFAVWGLLVLARFGRPSEQAGHASASWAFIVLTAFFAIVLPILALPRIALIQVADAILYALIGQLIITFLIVALLRAGETDPKGPQNGAAAAQPVVVVWETPRRLVWWALLLCFLGMFFAAAYFFTREGGSTNKNLSEAAASRNLNRSCLAGVGNSLDAHDVWHILGAYALFSFFCAIYYTNPPRPLWTGGAAAAAAGAAPAAPGAPGAAPAPAPAGPGAGAGLDSPHRTDAHHVAFHFSKSDDVDPSEDAEEPEPSPAVASHMSPDRQVTQAISDFIGAVANRMP